MDPQNVHDESHEMFVLTLFLDEIVPGSVVMRSQECELHNCPFPRTTHSDLKMS